MKTTVRDLLKNPEKLKTAKAVDIQEDSNGENAIGKNPSVDLKASSRQFVISVGTETFDVVDLSPPSAKYCQSASRIAPCYPVCCDSAYATSEFCRSIQCF